jgi:hypothetical protein
VKTRQQARQLRTETGRKSGAKTTRASKLNQAGASLKHDVARPQGNPARHQKKSEKACDAIIAGILK